MMNTCKDIHFAKKVPKLKFEVEQGNMAKFWMGTREQSENLEGSMGTQTPLGDSQKCR